MGVRPVVADAGKCRDFKGFERIGGQAGTLRNGPIQGELIHI